MNSQKIIGLAAPTQDTDAVDRDTADGRYMQQSITLATLGAPTSSVSMNSQKITGLAPATLSTDLLSRTAGDSRYY